MPEITTLVMAVVARGGHVLLVRCRAADGSLSWQFPVARVQYGESVEEAVAREVLEETGVECAASHVQGGWVDPLTGRRVIYLLCDFVAGAPRVADVATVTEVAWAAQDDLGAYGPGSVQAYIDILARQRGHADLAAQNLRQH